METVEELLACLPGRPRGENHPRARLSAQQVRLARGAKERDRTASISAMARIFNVSDSTLRAAVGRKTWKHVK